MFWTLQITVTSKWKVRLASFPIPSSILSLR